MWPTLTNLLRIHSLPQKNGTKPLLLYIVTKKLFLNIENEKAKYFKIFSFFLEFEKNPIHQTSQ